MESATTELVCLPGLEAAVSETEPKPGHWLEHMPQKRLMVFSGRSHQDLAERMAAQLGVELDEEDVGADRVLTMDLHAGQIQGFFTIPVDHMTALQLFATHFRDLGLTGEGIVAVAPDAGRAKHAVRFGEMIGAGFAVMHKARLSPETVEMTEVTGRVRDKIAIIGDDVSTTGGTIIAGADALREHGATEVWAFLTHALFSAEGLKAVGESALAGVVVTDTVPIDPTHRPEKMTVLPISGLLAETIMNVFSDDSVSAIFGGDTQLF